jgi:hypothetical protein
MRRLLVLLSVLATVAPMSARAAGLGVQMSRSEERGDDGSSTDAYGVFGRLNLIGPLHIYVDLAKLDVDHSGREDRRIGAGLQLDIPGLGKWVPMVLAGVGAQEAKDAEADATLVYSELGAGLAYRLAPALRLELDLRRGTISKLGDDAEDFRRFMGQEDERKYFAGRLSLALEF